MEAVSDEGIEKESTPETMNVRVVSVKYPGGEAETYFAYTEPIEETIERWHREGYMQIIPMLVDEENKAVYIARHQPMVIHLILARMESYGLSQMTQDIQLLDPEDIKDEHGDPIPDSG